MSAKPACDPKKQCQQVTADGRRCLMSRMKGHASLCFVHAQQQQQIHDPQRVAAEILGPYRGLKTANAVNHALGTLFLLVAQNRIPPRNATVLAYIGQLLLQSLGPVRSEIKEAMGWEGWDDALQQILSDATQAKAPGQLTQATIEANLPPEEEEEEEEEENETEGDAEEGDEAEEEEEEDEEEDALAPS